ncbi:MAG: cell wall-binding repeat-containing protein, partial [Campylobacteraceae bacterium]|nr:cell wall-binding repeat-containing protein [Campylobacteraceae bacterium]
SVESLYRLRANKVYVKSFNQDGETSRANGALSIVEGSYEFDLIQSEQPIPSIPLLVTSENQVTSKGILPALDGGALPLGKLDLNGAPVNYNYNGTFNLKNLDVAKQTRVELALVDVFGKTHRTLFELDNPYFVPSINTIAGSNRFHTGAMISQASHQTSDTAILVQSSNFPDALAAGPLAYQMDAPILLTKANELHSVTEAELKRLQAKHVVIMGGAGAVAPEVETAIKKLGMTVERISGSTAMGQQLMQPISFIKYKLKEIQQCWLQAKVFQTLLLPVALQPEKVCRFYSLIVCA